MGTEVGKHQATERAPAAASMVFVDTLRLYRSRIEWHPSGHYSISERSLPSDAERAAFVQRRAYLVESLTPADPRAIVQKVAQAFLRFPSSRVPDSAAQATLAAYASELQKFPLWVIDGGLLAAINGRGSPAFVPSAMEWRAACDDVAASVRKEIADIDRILNAEVRPEVTEEQRKKNLEGFRALIAELRLNEPYTQSRPDSAPLDPAAVEAKLLAERDAAAPVALSARLRANRGLSPDGEAREAAE